jgi:hypothetical protein
MFSKLTKAVSFAGLALSIAACSKGGGTFSLLSDSVEAKQDATYVARKIDILWVIDNSGSMATSQANLASNFQSFISRFNQYSYDFHMAVSTTDGWEKYFSSSSVKARFRDGVSSHSGVFVMDKNTTNLNSVFTTNISEGTGGNGDERAFQSFQQTLNDAFNISSGFRRSDAFLAIIIVSDEDDQSSTSSGFYEGTIPASQLAANPSLIYNNPNLISVQSYANFLATYTGGVASTDFSVSNISVQDDACRVQLDSDGDSSRKVNQRYNALTDLTGGVKSSLCSDFGTTLQLISDKIIQLSAVFKLTRVPVVSSIVVTVDGVAVAQDATNGWTYDSTANAIDFHGTAIPGANSTVKINFDPQSVNI